MTNEIVWVRVEEHARPAARYRQDGHQWVLDAVLPPTTQAPFDIGVLEDALWNDGSPLQVIVLGTLSHPPGTRLRGRLLGAFAPAGADSPPWLVAAVADDPLTAAWQQIADLPADLQSALRRHWDGGTPPQVVSATTATAWAQEALRAFRLAQAAVRTGERGPAWRPPRRYTGPTDAGDATHYTAAEYTFFQLPYRFQRYVEQHLAPDERVLYAIWRPAMTSRQARRWWRRRTRHEGVVLLTTQRLLNLTELVPPDRAGVRYGFHALSGPLERLHAASLERIADDAFLLHTAWQAADGSHTEAWEFPIQNLSALRELLTFLEAFLPRPGSRALQRSTPPDPPDPLPPLHDPAANEATATQRLDTRFRHWLAGHLPPDETPQAWALWPAWYTSRQARVMLVTDRHLWLLQDSPAGPQLQQQIPLGAIAALGFQASILGSALTLYRPGEPLRLEFPYPALAAFRAAGERLRRCLAASPARP